VALSLALALSLSLAPTLALALALGEARWNLLGIAALSPYNSHP